MRTPSQQSISCALRVYSVLAADWWDASGDTHELLAARERLGLALGALSASQRLELRQADDAVLAALDAHRGGDTFDVQMLRQAATLICSERDTGRLAA